MMTEKNYISELEKNGIKFDFEKFEQEALAELQAQLDKCLASLSAKLNVEGLSLDNAKEIVIAFNDNGIKLRFLTQEYLKSRRHEHEAIALLYRAKDIKGQLTKFDVEKLRERADENGRLHAEWQHILETTGRLSCKNPPLQSFPGAWRKYFIAEEGHCLVTADFSTIEMRVLARLSGDVTLLAELQAGQDIHRNTAAAIFNKAPEDVTEKERKIGKSTGFLITYGGTAYGLSKRLTEQGFAYSSEEAELLISNYYAEHYGVCNYHNLLKSRCIMPSTLSGHVFKGLEGSKLLNYPVQGSAAEGFSLTLTAVMNSLPDNYRLVMAIHDSITLEVPVTERDEAANYLKITAEQAMGAFLEPVPVVAEIKNIIYGG